MKFLTLVQGEAYALVCRKFKTSRSLNKSSTLWGEKSICTLSFQIFFFNKWFFAAVLSADTRVRPVTLSVPSRTNHPPVFGLLARHLSSSFVSSYGEPLRRPCWRGKRCSLPPSQWWLTCSLIYSQWGADDGPACVRGGLGGKGHPLKWSAHSKEHHCMPPATAASPWLSNCCRHERKMSLIFLSELCAL